MNKQVDNPWGLSAMQAAVLDAICEHGCHKLAAASLNRSIKTVEYHANKAGVRMGTRHTLEKYLAWDRWRRST